MSNEAFDQAVEKVRQHRLAVAAQKAAEEAKEQADKTRLLNEGPVWAKKSFDEFKQTVLSSVAKHSDVFSVSEDFEDSFSIDIENKWRLSVAVKDRNLTIKTLDADNLQNNALRTAPRYLVLESLYVEGRHPEEQGWKWSKLESGANPQYMIGDISTTRPADNAYLSSQFLMRITDLLSMDNKRSK